jgi:hypothetical protein
VGTAGGGGALNSANWIWKGIMNYDLLILLACVNVYGGKLHNFNFFFQTPSGKEEDKTGSKKANRKRQLLLFQLLPLPECLIGGFLGNRFMR